MKQLLAVILAAGFAGCAEQSEPVAISGTHYPYSRYSTTAEVSGPTTVYSTWTTDKLQKRRLELYAMVPQTQTRHGVPAYIHPADRYMLSDPARSFGMPAGQPVFGGLTFAEPSDVIELTGSDDVSLAGSSTEAEDRGSASLTTDHHRCRRAIRHSLATIDRNQDRSAPSSPRS